MTCDGMGFLTVPDPSTNFPKSYSQTSDQETSSDSYSRYEPSPRAQYDNEYVNDLPNTEEPDIFEADFPSLEESYWDGKVCTDEGCD